MAHLQRFSVKSREIDKSSESLLKLCFQTLVHFYKHNLAFIFGGNCRFYPSCSTYALEALEAHPTVKALQLIFKRILSCHPFGKSGYDPVPEGKSNE